MFGSAFIRAEPVVVPAAGVVRVGHEQQVRFTELAVADAEAQGGVEHFPADALDEGVERQEQES